MRSEKPVSGTNKDPRVQHARARLGGEKPDLPEDCAAYAEAMARVHLDDAEACLQKAIDRRGAGNPPNQRRACRELQTLRLKLAEITHRLATIRDL